MNCAEARDLLHAYLDDELGAKDALAIERHMAGCSDCERRYRAFSELKRAVRFHKPYRSAPSHLRNRVISSLPASQLSRPARLPRRRLLVGGALAASFAIAATIGAMQIYRLRAAQDDAFVAEVVSGHLRSMLAGHLTDVATSDQHTVKPWFDGRLDYSPLVKDLASQGFPLVGGRLDVLKGRRIAALVYRRHKHVINLYQWPEVYGLQGAGGHGTYEGYRVVQWSDAGMRYVVVSNVNASDLDKFIQEFREAPAIASERPQ